jgi:16S rRNA (guanine527-N7)-methyltransferase
VPGRDLESRILRRTTRAGLTPDRQAVTALAAYVALLARWNERINLTALPLSPPTDAAIDRLIVEPVLASRRVQPSDRLAIDVGTGGGSPAIPMKIMAPALRMILVEAKARKAAFLREACRTLALDNIAVEVSRFEELLTRVDLHEAADLVTMRAVKADLGFWRGTQALLKPGGRVFLFRTAPPGSAGLEVAPPLFVASEEHLGGVGNVLTIVTRRPG